MANPGERVHLGVAHLGVVHLGEREHLGVVHQLDAVASQRADHQEHQVGEPLALGEHLLQAASVGDDPPVPVWPVFAGVAPFGLPVIWAGVLMEEESGAHSLRLELDESEPYCEICQLMWVRAQ